jgi:phospholipase/carboxylesterase
MLEFLLSAPPTAKDGTPVLVLLHGRGSHMGDLQGLRRALPPEAAVLTPQAPHPGLAWGYGPGWAWYRYGGEDLAERGSILESLEALRAFMAQLPEHLGFRPGPLILGGFSQGGTTSLAYVLANPRAAAGIVNLSGFLINEDVLGVGPEALGKVPVFWGHGTQDPAVPHSLAELGRRRLQDAGVGLEARDYPMGHRINHQEVEDLNLWMETVIPGWPGRGSQP